MKTLRNLFFIVKGARNRLHSVLLTITQTSNTTDKNKQFRLFQIGNIEKFVCLKNLKTDLITHLNIGKWITQGPISGISACLTFKEVVIVYVSQPKYKRCCKSFVALLNCRERFFGWNRRSLAGIVLAYSTWGQCLKPQAVHLQRNEIWKDIFGDCHSADVGQKLSE